MKKSKLAVAVAAIFTMGLTGCSDDGSTIFVPQEPSQFSSDNQPLENPYANLYTDTTRPVLTADGKLIKDESGRVLVELLKDNEPTGEKGMLLVEEDLTPVIDEAGNLDLIPVPFPIVDEDGYLLDDSGQRITTDAGMIGKPLTDRDDHFVFDIDGSVVVDIYTPDGTLHGKESNTYHPDTGWSGHGPSFLISEGEIITDGDRNIIEDQNGNGGIPTLDENGDNVSSPDGNIIVDIVDPDTSEKTGEKGELIINPDGNGSIQPLPPVLIDDNGYITDGNGNLVVTEDGDWLKPNYDSDGDLITDQNGHPVVDIIDPQTGLLVQDGDNAATTEMNSEGDVEFIDERPHVMVSPGEITTDSWETATIIDGEANTPVTNDDGEYVRSPEGNLIVDIVESDPPHDPVDRKGQLVVDPETGLVSIEPLPLVLIDDNGYVINGNGEQVKTEDGELLKPNFDGDGDLVTAQNGNVVVDIYDPNTGSVVDEGDNAATIEMDQNGEVEVTEGKPDVMVSPGEVITDGDNNPIVDENGNVGIPQVDDNGDILKDDEGNIIVDIVDPDTNTETGEEGEVEISPDSGAVIDSSADSGNDLTLTVDETNKPTNASEATHVSAVVSGIDDDIDTVEVTYSDGDSSTADVSAIVTQDSSGNWIISPADIRALLDGNITATVLVHDDANHTATAQDSLLKDTSFVTGNNFGVTTDSLINQAETGSVPITLDDIGDEATSVAVTFTDSNGDTVTVDAELNNGSWTIDNADLSALADGDITATITASDDAGNSQSADSTIVKDTSFNVGQNFGVAVDSLINESEAGSVPITLNDIGSEASNVEVTFTDSNNDTVTVDAELNNGVWTIDNADLSALADGDITVTITASDDAGNSESVDSTIVKDTSFNVGQNFGVTLDSLINATESPSVPITLNDIGSEATNVEVTFTDSNGDTVTIDAELNNGSWTIDNADLSALADGDITVTVTASDDAGNTESVDSTIVKDTSFNVGQNFGVTLDSLINATEALSVPITLDDIGSEANNVEVTFTDSNGDTVTIDAELNNGSWTIDNADLSALADGDITVTITASDDAGNSESVDSTIVKDTSFNVGQNFGVTLDSLINATEALSVPITLNDIGSEATNVEVTFTDSSGNDVTVDAQLNNGVWTVNDADLSSLADGDITVSITASDDAGNHYSEGETLTKDTSIQGNPQLSVEPDDQLANSVEVIDISTLLSNIDNEVTAITVKFSDGDSSTTDITVDALLNQTTNQWTVPQVDITSLQDGTISVTATLSDVAGNTSSISTTLTKDTVIATLSGFAVNALTGSDTLINSVEAQSVQTVISNVSAEAIKVVVTYSDGKQQIELDATQDPVTNEWTVPNTAIDQLDDGTITVSVIITDDAGNEATTSSSFVKDTIANGNISVNILDTDKLANLTEVSDINIAFVGIDNDVDEISLTFSDSDTTTGDITVLANKDATTQQWSVADTDISSLTDGNINVSVFVTDIAGNSATIDETLQKDTTAEADDNLNTTLASTDILITGTDEQHHVEVTVNGFDDDVYRLLVTVFDTGVHGYQPEVPYGVQSLTTNPVVSIRKDATDQWYIEHQESDLIGNTTLVTNSDGSITISTIDIYELLDGAYGVSVWVSDLAGNQFTTERKISGHKYVVDPLPPVLVDGDGYVIDGNGVHVKGPEGQLLTPQLDSSYTPVQELDGSVVVDMHDSSSTVTGGATVSMSSDGSVTVGSAPIIIVDGTLFDVDGNDITYGLEDSLLKPIDGATSGVNHDTNGSVLLEVLDSNNQPTGEIRVVQPDGSGGYALNTNGDPIIVKPGLIIDANDTVINAYGNELYSSNGNSIQLLRNSNGELEQVANAGYKIRQPNGITQVDEDNVMFVNFITGELWTDYDGNVVTQKNIPLSNAYENSLPNQRSVDNTYLGFAHQSLTAQPVIVSSNDTPTINNWVSSSLFVTNIDTLLGFGRGAQGFVSSIANEKTQQINLSGDLEDSAGGVGIYEYEIHSCQFDDSTYIDFSIDHFNGTNIITPDNSYFDQLTDDEKCLPNNLAQIATNGYKQHALNVMITHTNELWSVGDNVHGLGGLVGDARNIPYKYADNIKTSTLVGHAGEYAYYNYILDGDGQVWDVNGSQPRDANNVPVLATSDAAKPENGGVGAWNKFPVIDNEVIVNIRTIRVISHSHREPLAVTASGKYYMLKSDGTTEQVAIPEFPKLTMLLSVTYSDADKMYKSSFLGDDGAIYSNEVDGLVAHKQVDSYLNYSGLVGAVTDVPDDVKIASGVTFEWVSGIGNFFYAQLLKDSLGNYYVLKGLSDFYTSSRTQVLLTAGITDSTEALLQDSFIADQSVKLIKLTDDLEYIQFLNNDTDWTFARNNTKFLFNNSTEEVAFIGGTENISGSGQWQSVFTSDVINSGSKTYDSVTIMPDAISSKLFHK
ncbi:beta strand repeat-containing protein [Vibrio sonorensis]|uniref:beta strand repeat-containing protein n=1 Tax=Vibrio sonorensis TaxID=1004316 RepID=UPI0008DA5482|nr:hypothetical protein [Vibrio sonorensis]